MFVTVARLPVPWNAEAQEACTRVPIGRGVNARAMPAMKRGVVRDAATAGVSILRITGAVKDVDYIAYCGFGGLRVPSSNFVDRKGSVVKMICDLVLEEENGISRIFMPFCFTPTGKRAIAYRARGIGWPSLRSWGQGQNVLSQVG